MSISPLRVGVVGVRGVGLRHAQSFAALPEFEVVAGCDLVEAQAQEFAAQFPSAQAYTDYAQMLSEARPDVVVVATSTASHAALTIQAVEAGARGVYCEKPMSTNLADAIAMVEACRQHKSALVVNHQRRMLPVFITMRRLIEEGAIGNLELIRGGCAGDVLSDGTHLVDTVRHLNGDTDVSWVFAQIHRERPNPDEPRGGGFNASGGWRYGHVIETGGFSILQFANGVRAELATGAIQPRGRPYQDYEIVGSTGRMRRAGDRSDPALIIQTDDQPGWRPVEIDQTISGTLGGMAPSASYQRFAQMIHQGVDHPMSGDTALKDQEVVMAIYESARLRDRVMLPLAQQRFPLELLVESGEL
jgi:predicted dehydrogenase